MLRWLIRVAAILVIVVAALVVLAFAELLVWVGPDDTASMATTIPGCKGRVVAQGLSYKFSDPGPGDVVVVHAAETDAGQIIPDKDATDLRLVLRVAAGPGDTIVGKAGTVFVNQVKFDDITTKPFQRVKVPERAVLPARRQPLGGHRQPDVRPRGRERDLREGLRRLLATARHHVPPRPVHRRAPGPHRL